MYVCTPPGEHDASQGQFLSRVEQVLIQKFPSSTQVATSKIKNLACPPIFS